jgi:sulfite reductase (NADPH) flavoprotein alpha-component
VTHLIEALQASAEEEILDTRSGQTLSLRQFLTHKANLARLTSSFLKLFYAHESTQTRKNRLQHLLDEKTRLTQYLTSHDPLDAYKEFGSHAVPLQALCEQFGPLLPRFYSIASSPLIYPDEIHLTVALFSFSHQGELRYGTTSHFLSSLALPHTTPILAYVQPSSHFSLPQDPTLPLILIGPGTGLAPYRAFIQERVALNAPGNIWLFFGERNRATDYLYEEELEAWHRSKHIKLSLAFSRDQPEKLYVQHRMLENAPELWKWLQEGALFYVCGDAHQMAKDVERTLIQIAQSQGSLTEENARLYVKTLRTSRRYLTDVY